MKRWNPTIAYAFDDPYGAMEEAEGYGEWVRYEDATQRIAELEKEIDKFLAMTRREKKGYEEMVLRISELESLLETK